MNEPVGPVMAERFVQEYVPAVVKPIPTTTLEQPKETHVASFKSILSDIGSGLKKFFTGAVEVAKDAEPFVDTLFPGVAALYNTTVTAVGTVEAASIAAGAQSGTGAQKLAAVTSTIEADFNAYWTAIGNKETAPQTVIEQWVNAVVASLNAIPSTPTTAA
jgi:hypothetical protein